MTIPEIQDAMNAGESFNAIVDRVMDRVVAGGEKPTHGELACCACYIRDLADALGNNQVDDFNRLLVLKIALILGTEYLSSTKPDDDDPWDLTWLEAQGFERKNDGGDDPVDYWALVDNPGPEGFSIQYCMDYQNSKWQYVGHEDDNSVCLADPQTKGDVRRLCHALHFELTEDKEAACGRPDPAE